MLGEGRGTPYDFSAGTRLGPPNGKEAFHGGSFHSVLVTLVTADKRSESLAILLARGNLPARRFRRRGGASNRPCKRLQGACTK
jgi:hypothetical protein